MGNSFNFNDPNEVDRVVLSAMKELKRLKNPETSLAPRSDARNGYYGYAGTHDGADDELHLLDYWRPVRKRLWLVIGITLLGAALAVLYVARQPDIYEAQARVQVNLENSGVPVSKSQSGAVVLTQPLSDPAYFNTQLQILSGPGLLRRVVKTLDLENNREFFKSNNDGSSSTWQNLRRMAGFGKQREQSPDDLNDLPQTNSVAPATARDDLAEARRLQPYVSALRGGLSIEPVVEKRVGYIKDTRLIDIRFTHGNPHLAAKLVNSIADTYTLQNLERKTETTMSAGDFLQRRVAELQAQIRMDEERLINYAKNNQILSLDAGQNTVVERLVGLNRQLLEAENERKLAEAAYRAAGRPGAAMALAERDAGEINQLEMKLADLRQKRAQLLVENTEEWPEVKEVNGQIATLEKQIDEIRNRATTRLTTNLETRYQEAVAREQSLRAAFNQQKGETLTQNEAAINYRIIQQEIETNKNLLDGLLQGSKQNDMVLAETPNNVYVVDYAIAPGSAVGPKRFQTILLAFLLSLAAGIGLALLLDYLDSTLRSVDDVEKQLRLPALAVIPNITPGLRRKLIGYSKSNLPAKVNGNGNGHHPELLLGMDGHSPIAEAYRHLRTSVLLSTAGRAPKTILVTSSLPAEGKTTTAVNTALSLAQTGEDVVVIDADMRKPRLHRIFDLENDGGLSSILSRKMSEEEILASVQRHESSGLYVLASGNMPPNPAELLGSAEMRKLLAVLERRFKYVVIDSPPVVSFTDAVVLGSAVDGVLLVVQGGKSSREVARRSRQLLTDVGAKIFGVVVNRMDPGTHDDYYYYQHYYGTRPAAEA